MIWCEVFGDWRYAVGVHGYLNDVDGVPFEQANRKLVNYEGHEMNFIGLEELLVLKKIAGRSQDKTDIEKLLARNKKK